jgi:hypothetical protein
MLSPERYQGHIILKDARIPFAATISADSSGDLKFEVEPLPFDEQQSALLTLMQTVGQPGTVTSEFGLECTSDSGKQLRSQRVFLGEHSHKEGTLQINIEVYEAELSMRRTESSPAPTLQFRIRGMRSFGPTLQATTRLGTVRARGMTEVPDPDAITGQLQVEAPQGLLSPGWRQEAYDLLMHMRMALSFANAGHLTTPIVEYWEDNTLTVSFYRAGSSGTPELPVQHFLNLGPFFTSVATNYDAARSNRDALANAIGWLHVETTHDEVRFLTGMTALEYLASHQLPQEARQLLPEAEFQRVKNDIEALLDGTQLCQEAKQALKARVEGLNRQSLVQNIRALFAHWNVSRIDIPGRALRRLVDTRNNIVHRGIAADEETLWELIIIVREITARFVFALLGFEGNYQCYMGGRHIRRFPSCERIPNS